MAPNLGPSLVRGPRQWPNGPKPRAGPDANLSNCSRLKLVGSCNGLLCFYDLESTKSLYIVNPMTGEYVHTPQKLRKERLHIKSVQAVYGFGFSQETNQYKYKVIRVTKKLSQSLCEIFTLGTNKRRNISNIPFPVNTEYFGVPLNGAIHWIAGYEIPMSSELICAFDIDSEKGRPILPPLNFDDRSGEG
ncbi:putative F-box protein At1g33530 [Quercus suber]|nr:putative F-box protein At1g33530 [Quercus suber]